MLDESGHASCVLVAHSAGATIALSLAARHEGQVKGLALIDVPSDLRATAAPYMLILVADASYYTIWTGRTSSISESRSSSLIWKAGDDWGCWKLLSDEVEGPKPAAEAADLHRQCVRIVTFEGGGDQCTQFRHMLGPHPPSDDLRSA